MTTDDLPSIQIPDIPVIYCDERIVVVDKPSGLLCVPGIGPEKADCVATRVAAAIEGARIVHRLDRDTSGVLIMARDAAAHRDLSIQFQERHVAKEYVAAIHGVPSSDGGTIELPLRKDLDDPPRQCVDHEQGKPSTTHWFKIQSSDSAAVVRLVPITGRSHQLRVHLKEIGHPILGDDLYAPEPARSLVGRLMLHARTLSVVHPETAAPMTFTSPCTYWNELTPLGLTGQE
jgi:tRNA pseudouridine32 synthase/23S rRNA pseudouridine746 synthase